jgi:hypothetical protein
MRGVLQDYFLTSVATTVRADLEFESFRNTSGGIVTILLRLTPRRSSWRPATIVRFQVLKLTLMSIRFPTNVT